MEFMNFIVSELRLDLPRTNGSHTCRSPTRDVAYGSLGGWVDVHNTKVIQSGFKHAAVSAGIAIGTPLNIRASYVRNGRFI